MGEQRIFIMDNAKCHNNLIIKDLLNNVINGIYLPPYSPELNPIELVFNKFKSELKKTEFFNEDFLLF